MPHADAADGLLVIERFSQNERVNEKRSTRSGVGRCDYKREGAVPLLISPTATPNSAPAGERAAPPVQVAWELLPPEDDVSWETLCTLLAR